jgi:hypothetical protein
MMALDQALRLLQRGLSVIPVPRPRPGIPAGRPGDGKVPAIAWREYQKRLPTEDEIRGWFTTDMNIAVITGMVSNVVVIDGDSPESVRWLTKHLPYTPWQTQTARGFHLWYRHPGVHVANRARIETGDGRLAIDLRGDNGFVIVAGSIHASGAVYLEAGDWTEPRERVPVFWPGWLQRPARPAAPRATTRPTGDVVERARRYLAAIPRPEIGQGSDVATLSAACRLTRGFGLTEGDAIALLWAWAGGRPGWTHGWIAEKVRHAQRYGTEPIGALR